MARRTLVVLALVAGACFAPIARAGWDPASPAAGGQIRHAAFEQFLIRYLRVGQDGLHRVAYAEVAPASRAALDRYIEGLTTIPLARFGRNEQLAYWLNLYNALVIRLVLEHYPIESILDITGPDGRGPFGQPLVEVDGHWRSLDAIRDDILMAGWGDPRIPFGLSCGAIGCPDLQPEPFVGWRVDSQLNEAAMAYVNDRRCLTIREGKLTVSSLYRWYQGAFGGSDRGVIRYLMSYAEPALAKRLEGFERIEADAFDWRLNDATPR
jgi:hypothetical protein